jgi:hypothetical protein
MTDFEQSHGKPRPTLLRRTDVRPEEPRTDGERLEGRNADGTASPGNQLALGRGWKSTIRKTVDGAAKALGVEGAGDADMRRIADEAAVVYRAILGALPLTGPLVRINAAGVAREFATAGFLDAKASEAGLLTEIGERLAQRASYHRARAERLSVTTHALAARAGGRKKRRQAPWVTSGGSDGGQSA